MGDFFLDDQFPDHPKAIAAGDDACWLYVCGLAWAHRHNNGLIPINAVLKLTAKPNNEELASVLCRVKLWHKKRNGFEIHDWYTRNAKMVVKREKAQRAAHAKWQKFYEERDANADASAMQTQPDPLCETSADAMPYQPRNQGVRSTPVVPLKTAGSYHGKNCKCEKCKPRVMAQPPSFAAADADLPPRDPEAGSRMRGVQAEMAERWGKK